MCGIVGYIGQRNAVPLILNGLSRLEYRGYDSAGLAVQSAEGEIALRKSVGRLSELETVLKAEPASGSAGVGHTRWATHGPPNLPNCHPHQDQEGHLALVHNGIIENYLELKDELESQGYSFSSDTDTEVLTKLIAREVKKASSLPEALRNALSLAKGAYALGIVSQDEPDVVYAARLGSPLIIGLGQDENFIASDVPAIIKYVDRVIYLDDGEIARLTQDDIQIQKLDGSEVTPEISTIEFEAESADRGGFETYMLKEVHEQPRVLRGLLDQYVHHSGKVDISSLGLDKTFFEGLSRVVVISCGTAYYAGMYGKMVIEELTPLPAEIDLASEFRYRNPKVNESMLVIAVSQSGETADTLASVRLAKEKGCKVLSICNVPGSSLVRESDAVMFINAGPEIGVASTKAFTAQLMAFALLGHGIAEHLGSTTEALPKQLEALENIPDQVHYLFSRIDEIKAIADKHHDGPSALYLGRRFNYPTALEGALKNKEISYQHAEGYAAGEMKHGPIALISEYMPVICICTRTEDEVYEKVISNMKEVEARHGRIIAIANDNDEQVDGIAEDVIHVPETLEIYSPLINVVALQLLAYYAAQARGTDIDKPRNLAKSVTVE